MELYQNPPTTRDIVTDALDSLQAQIDELTKNTNQSKHWNADFTNTIFIGDSFAAGWYEGHGNDDVNNWCVQFANMMHITNYRRYAKGGLCFNYSSSNNLKDYLINTINPNERDKSAVTSIMMMIGVNDSLLGANDNLYDQAYETLNSIKTTYPNAEIYLFYSAVRNLREGRSFRRIMEPANNLGIAFMGESYLWNIGMDTTYYVKGNSSCYHPTEKGSKLIAEKMRNYFLLGDLYSFHSTYISFEHTYDSTKDDDIPFDIHGGMHIKVNNNVVNIDLQANIFKKANWSENLILASTLDEAYRPDGFFTIATEDTSYTHQLAAFDINGDSQTTKITIASGGTWSESGMIFKANSTIDIGSWCYL